MRFNPGDNITAYYVARNAIYQIKAIAAVGTTFFTKWSENGGKATYS